LLILPFIDRYVIEYLGTTSKQAKNPKPITFLAVYDGHGGAEASQFCSDWLSSYVRKDKEYPINISNAMKSAFTKVSRYYFMIHLQLFDLIVDNVFSPLLQIDKDFVASGYLDGSTVCACAVIGDETGYEKIICANAGDSRAIVVKKNGSFVALSDDHKPDRNDETKRINDLGGKVIHWGRWRVEGVLAVSRSVGDARLKPYVTAEPDVVEYTLEDDDMFLVIASDGVWDTMSSDLVAKFTLVNSCKIVDKRLEVDDSLLRWIARQISKRARENGSSDNTSVIVANLQRKT
jgi:serine/threonine protein phosphatase PrpC